jgi:ERCC4-type nuclease
MVLDQINPGYIPFHELLMKKGRNFSRTCLVHILADGVECGEYFVKVPETGKRSTCYHSLRKVLAPRRAHMRRRRAVQAMPRHPPVPIHIRIDTQEQRSGIPDLLTTMPQVYIEVTPLHMGDYDIGGAPCRVLERKTGSDFLCSLEQGRLFPQLTALRKSGFAPILLLEGDPLCVGYSQMRPESIRGALAYITAIMRVPILPSSGPVESAHLVYAAARQCQTRHSAHSPVAHGPVAGRHRATQSEQQMQIVLSLPGIGSITARAVCARFGSLHDLLNADAAQLATIPGVGPSRAAALEQLLHAALPTSHDALTSKRREDIQMQAPTT